MKLLFTLKLLLASTVIVFAQQVEIRDLKNFDEVHISGSMDVTMEKGSSTKIKIEATNFELGKIQTRVEGKILKIYTDKMFPYPKNVRIKMYLSYDKVSQIKGSGSGNIVVLSDIEGEKCYLASSGSGDLTVKATIIGDALKIRNSGSGDVDIQNIRTTSAEATFSGSGDGLFHKLVADRVLISGSGSTDSKIKSGNTINLKLKTSGSGNIHAFGLSSKNCTASTSGSGRIYCSVSQSLSVRSSGSGGVHYKGNPSIEKMHTSGSGKLRKVD